MLSFCAIISGHRALPSKVPSPSHSKHTTQPRKGMPHHLPVGRPNHREGHRMRSLCRGRTLVCKLVRPSTWDAQALSRMRVRSRASITWGWRHCKRIVIFITPGCAASTQRAPNRSLTVEELEDDVQDACGEGTECQQHQNTSGGKAVACPQGSLAHALCHTLLNSPAFSPPPPDPGRSDHQKKPATSARKTGLP